MFGHRPDGKRLKNLDPVVQMTPYLMPMRCDAQVFLEHRADYETMSRYIAQKSQQGQKVTFMQILVAAYVRAVSSIRKSTGSSSTNSIFPGITVPCPTPF